MRFLFVSYLHRMGPRISICSKACETTVQLFQHPFFSAPVGCRLGGVSGYALAIPSESFESCSGSFNGYESPLWSRFGGADMCKLHSKVSSYKYLCILKLYCG